MSICTLFTKSNDHDQQIGLTQLVQDTKESNLVFQLILMMVKTSILYEVTKIYIQTLSYHYIDTKFSRPQFNSD